MFKNALVKTDFFWQFAPSNLIKQTYKMRKIYLLLMVSVFAIASASAKSSPKVKLLRTNSERGSNPGNTTNQVAGTISCTTQYVAGTSMTLNFVLTLTNTDYEYVDYFEMTFPAGITPTGTTNQPVFAPITDNATGQTPEAYNGIVGQTISWGDNDNAYGGIESVGNVGGITTYNFDVSVNIAPSVTGNQSIAFLLSGDTYNVIAPAGDLNGTITVFPAGAPIDDASVSVADVFSLSSCNNTQLPVAARIKNLGNTTISNFPISYVIDANAPVTETVTDVLAPGDSVDFVFATLGDFSAEAAYTINVYTALANDVIATNDAYTVDFVNTVSVNLSTTAYANDFETNADFLGLTAQANAGSTSNWGVSQTTFQSGAQALFMTGATAIADAWLFTKCMDVTSNETYRITYWKRCNSGFNGNIGISYGDANDAASMTNVIQAPTALNANSTWELDSAFFTPTTSGTVYIGFIGNGTAAGSGTNVRIDNINITNVTPVGIANVAGSNYAIYPNPSTGLINISVNAKAIMSVYDILGNQVIANRELTAGMNKISLEELNNGNYFVRMNVNGTVSNSRITIAK